MKESNKYIFESDLDFEEQRLLNQTASLRPEAEALLKQIQIKSDWRMLDIGCGPIGILDLLAEKVGKTGAVIGLDREERFVTMARKNLAARNLNFVKVVQAEACDSVFEEGSFDFVHERLVLINQPDPERVLREMVRITRPGGWVALQDVDQSSWFCEPPHPAWDTLLRSFQKVYEAMGLDPFFGRQLPGMLRRAGLSDVGVEIRIRVDPVGDYRRKQLLELVHAVRDKIISLGILTEDELAQNRAELERHLDNPETVVPRELLFQAWGRKPIGF